ncbi:hypothetical protein RUM43_008992 [Polyplax serrata]|uniref:Uncharacterized protein n=1 Tax=Polyplax serrata TaxID=468196 RepID=A0AAN8NNN9_POLSC
MLPSTSKLQFKKPGDIYRGFEEDAVDIDPNSSTTFIYNPNVTLPFEQQKQRLPIYKVRNHILYLLEKYQILVLVGETGCGKSTQIPQILLFCFEDALILAVKQNQKVVDKYSYICAL